MFIIYIYIYYVHVYTLQHKWRDTASSNAVPDILRRFTILRIFFDFGFVNDMNQILSLFRTLKGELLILPFIYATGLLMSLGENCQKSKMTITIRAQNDYLCKYLSLNISANYFHDVEEEYFQAGNFLPWCFLLLPQW